MSKSYCKFKTCNNASSNYGKKPINYKEKNKRKDKRVLQKLLKKYDPEEIDEIFEDYELSKFDSHKSNLNDNKIKITAQDIEENNIIGDYTYEGKFIRK